MTEEEKTFEAAYVAGVYDTIKYIQEAITNFDIDVNNWSNKPMASLITLFREQQQKIDELEYQLSVYKQLRDLQ